MSLKQLLLNVNSTINRWIADGQEIQHQKEIQVQESIRIAGENFINNYGENFHCSNEQYFRFQRALSSESIGKVVSVNKKKMSMKICSSCNANNIYTTSLSSCECEDFKKRHLPCKHIYKLALELRVIDENWDLSGLSLALKESLDSLSKTAIQTLISLMDNHRNTYKFQVNKRTASPLVKCGFLIEDDLYELLLDKNYNKEDLLAFLSASSSCTVSTKDKKSQIIRYIVDHEPKLLKALRDKCYTVSFSDTLTNNFDYIYRYCLKLKK